MLTSLDLKNKDMWCKKHLNKIRDSYLFLENIYSKLLSERSASYNLESYILRKNKLEALIEVSCLLTIYPFFKPMEYNSLLSRNFLFTSYLFLTPLIHIPLIIKILHRIQILS